ncbi:D-beta-hydroxybutyrate dehydrogenase, mitochondrial [Tribolium castaneum]|uniref:D-beta-hydroxybutyrate dehydrogenase, mitochondrial-like Protein n=1 Tax=Tribolium castaneum TaxID=7070 RepID=D6WSF7_TRICA|nr:PREDICTED: D-beta-hydroxybutyrate dehydrogenase, mitochondrial [Tribolium castaneum]EFA06375.2 D-beta-hydroxybutyrate dehydrogenase, mitochondrial-like Protein [Tribolium castaneum]|eukprot:XP_973118.1 PREDICTED: D-beta-hydroxybutyrate dehydrogenase, mitochondrial [Tribolium castaneum]
MSILSKLCLTVFEIVNELYIGVGAGVVGLAVLINHGYRTNQLLRTLTVSAISLASLIYVFQSSAELRQPSLKQIVLISGCDSGLGFSLAIHAARLGFTVVAGFLDLESPGAREIKQFHRKITQIQLDVTSKESVFVAVETINQYLNSNPSYEFYALVNNAGVMVFGEFEWQTERLIHQQVHVNLMGTMNVSRAFIPLLRKYHGRLINITSHCSFTCLPGLSVYGATKAGIKAFSDGLRIELGKYGVKVVMLTPGSFVTQSNIMAKHPEHVHEMHRNFSKEQRGFYEEYFQRYHAYLLGITAPKIPKPIQDSGLYRKFEEALCLETPKPAYKVEPFRYAFYHFLFKISPTPLRDYFVVRFMNMPEYHMTQIW